MTTVITTMITIINGVYLTGHDMLQASTKVLVQNQSDPIPVPENSNS